MTTRRLREMIEALHALWTVDPTLKPPSRIEAARVVRPSQCRCGHARSQHRRRERAMVRYGPRYVRATWLSRGCVDHCEFRCRRYVPYWAVLLGLRDPALRPPEFDAGKHRWVWAPFAGDDPG